MIEIPGRIPVIIHPFFWLLAGMIGWMNSHTLMGTLIWVGIIFFSVLIHEYGHALTALLFKQKTQIQLVTMGGVTSFEGPKLKFWQQFLITLNGPLFGFGLYLLATFLLQYNYENWPLFAKILKATQVANLFWTVINLLPVIPLDGGQLLRIVLEACFGVGGFKASLLIGAIVSVLIAFYFFLIQAFLPGALFFLFAFQSFDGWRKSRFTTRDDRDENQRQLLAEAEMALGEGKKEEAKHILQQVKEKATGGILFFTASQYLAFLAMQEGKKQEAYELLLPIKEQLADDSLCLLHKLAAEQKNYAVVAELAASCYQVQPSFAMALNNARAFASLGQAKPAGGWLQTAFGYGGLILKEVLQEEPFLKIKETPDFREFIDNLQ